MGRKAYEREAKAAKQAEELAGIGLPQDQIAVLLDISESTLKKYYAPELKRGTIKGNAKIAGWAFASAQSGNVTMQIFLAKVRLGWKETEDKATETKEQNNIIINVSPEPK
jgi:DNA-binding CsgD family transcriptional regulator